MKKSLLIVAILLTVLGMVTIAMQHSTSGLLVSGRMDENSPQMEKIRQEYRADEQARLEREKAMQKKSYLGVMGRVGYVIAQIEAGGPAEQAGLESGDVILSINGIQINSVDDMRRFSELKPGEQVNIEFTRPSSGEYFPAAKRSVKLIMADYSSRPKFRAKQ